MSTSSVALASFGRQTYFCHQCERTVTITPSLTGDVLCSTCNSGFVEEYQNPNPEPLVPEPFSLFLSQLLSHSENPNIASRSVPADHSPLGPGIFDPAAYLLNLLANRRASGIDYEFVFDDHPSASGFSLQANMGDYFMGLGFEQLIQQLAENDPNRYGTPPASKSSVEALPNVNVDEGLLKAELAQCAVCKDDFEMGTVVKQMPCKHVYHHECILPWLELHNSCPVCRYELPTEDPDYESGADSASRRGDNATRDDGSNIGVDGVAGSSDGSTMVERRFIVSLPRIFGDFFGSGSGSDSGSEDPDYRHREQS